MLHRKWGLFMKLLEKWLFGLNGPVDEAQSRELSHIGSKGLMLSLILNIVILVVSFILDVLQRTIGFQTILIAFMLMIVSGYITVLLNNSLSSSYEIYSEKAFKNVIKKLKIKTIVQTIFAFVVFNIIFSMGSAYILNESVSAFDLLASTVICLAYGFGMYAWNRSKIRKEY
ncbi:hypothetical protein HMPREF9103_02048 [Lentilactobacillus parafarraginis F0439]|uniref:DUF3278 domain-containing protein n=2 Tax=Lentilactobacillus parafarraginis TaxID=390842 RepID=G9ZQP1_9LACO|nr:hypothetical protein HMPREF9103_02048 [Lentilactobacillus parafarraginis F0439]